ncbi:MAG: competence/damage-inducible protein A [Rhodospirillales bacterium]|nr:competence/damage-inducible protein A [Rhodospirillales bacterium]
MSKPSEKPAVTAAVIIIGNEVLSGRTQDANLQFLATGLNEIGVRLMEARIIADVEAEIVAAVNELRAKHDYVFTTGGIGPTHDDITSASVAKAFGRAFGRNAEAEALLRSHYKPQDVTESRLAMANTPDGVTLLENPVSKAPGFQIENVFVLPGVPMIMQAMFGGLKHILVGGDPILSKTITAFIPESVVAKPLGELQEKHPSVEIGSYPFFRGGKLGTSLVSRSTDAAALETVAEGIRALIRGLGGEPAED